MKQADGVLRRMTFVDIDRPVIELAARLQPATLRTLDAIHVASAMQLGSELRSFVTYDQRLADAARAAGLTVVSPGS
jgi:predicted nucleic acid-binding protein